MNKQEQQARGDLGDGRRLAGTHEVAVMLGVSERHVRREIQAGRLPHRRLGARDGSWARVKIMIPDDLDAYLAASLVDDPAA